MLIKRNYHILVNNYDFMNQEGWYSLMLGILFQTGIDTLYVTLKTQKFDTKNRSKTKHLGVIKLVMVSSRYLMQNVHDKTSPLNIGQRKVTTSIVIGCWV